MRLIVLNAFNSQTIHSLFYCVWFLNILITVTKTSLDILYSVLGTTGEIALHPCKVVKESLYTPSQMI